MAFDRRETAVLLTVDFLILVASLWAALILRNLSLVPFSYLEENILPFLPVFVLSIAIFYIAGLYEKQTRPIRRVMGVRILGAQVATVAIAGTLFFILPLSIAPKTILVLYLVVSVIGESVWRFYSMKREMKADNQVPAILIGSGPAVTELFEEVNANDRFLIHFVRHTDIDGHTANDIGNSITEGIKQGAKIVVIDTSNPKIFRDIPAFRAHVPAGVALREFASLYEEIFDQVPLNHLNASQLLESLPKHRALYDIAKRLFDIALVVVGSVLAIPFVAIVALLLTINGGTPFIFNERIGKNDRLFRIIKLRSMLLNDHGDPELQKKNRVTAFGHVLRKTRLDELPQLWNVFAGDLSFIGPRPELPKIAEVYEREIPQYRLRHMIAPGLSGWAQIHDADAPRGPADVLRTRRKLSFDLYYLKHRSFGLDIAIALKTVRALLSFSGT